MNKRFIATLLALPLAVSSAFAQDSGTAPTVKISGFGTGALTWTNTDDAEFARPNQASGVRKDPRTGVDSNLGLQASVDVNNWLSGTVQGLVRKDADEGYGADLSWAFVKMKVSDRFSVRVGRMGLPVFMISDYRNVGYANTMVRPSAEVYSQVPFDTIDGIDGTFQHSIGDTTLTTQLAVGKTRPALGPAVHLETDLLTALNLVAEHGPLTVRIGHARAKVSIDDSASLNTLLSGLRGAGAGYKFPQLPILADALSVQKKQTSFSSAGAILDWNNVLVQTEYAKRKTDSYINDTSSWYLMAGYRIGKFLPYASHASLKRDGIVTNTVPAACPPGYPAACTPTLQALSAGVTRLSTTGAQGQQQTNTIGVRWDFHRSAALKVQIDRVKPQHGQGLLLTPAASFTGPVTVGAVAVDFVF
ncbi:hypothetical protein CR105_08915 [Massilia eurypsychrophila]|uniref:Porin domain-containing protein n=1 Tax=Massilia eurypsychrophila TaxID=1485217 RepID=A0A2G8TGW8_9BURK|nr:hypothetical protein [Massilia eurypsychrophila]PIL45292.1 hypothetical protein CR105_08915 [Massilia eurypsychrophila]